MAYRKNHIATAGYLRRWAGADGQLRVVAAGGVASGSAKPKSVGHRTNFWSEDPAMRKGVEVAISPIESRAARCLDKVVGTWPPDPDDPAWIATIKFIALHLIRNPAAMRRLRAVQEQLVPRALDRHRHWTLRQQNGFLAHVTSDVFRTETSMKLLIHGSSLLASMHATLVVFDDRLLATSDQPVTVVPWLEADQTAPVRLFPSESLVNCREIRWAVDPQHALVFTWLEEPFGVARPGTDALAAQLNRAVVAQADAQWFHHPARRPTRLASQDFDLGTCRAVSRTLHPHYGLEEAATSRRRAEGSRLLEAVIRGGLDELRWVGVRRDETAAA